MLSTKSRLFLHCVMKKYIESILFGCLASERKPFYCFGAEIYQGSKACYFYMLMLLYRLALGT